VEEGAEGEGAEEGSEVRRLDCPIVFIHIIIFWRDTCRVGLVPDDAKPSVLSLEDTRSGYCSAGRRNILHSYFASASSRRKHYYAFNPAIQQKDASRPSPGIGVDALLGDMRQHGLVERFPRGHPRPIESAQGANMAVREGLDIATSHGPYSQHRIDDVTTASALYCT